MFARSTPNLPFLVTIKKLIYTHIYIYTICIVLQVPEFHHDIYLVLQPQNGFYKEVKATYIYSIHMSMQI